jgi:hypothetical protein
MPTIRPTIFTVSALWDDEAGVWMGSCDAIPASAEGTTLDELLARMSAMTVDVLPDNHPDLDPAGVFLQITALQAVMRSGAARLPEGASPFRSASPAGIRRTRS